MVTSCAAASAASVPWPKPVLEAVSLRVLQLEPPMALPGGNHATIYHRYVGERICGCAECDTSGAHLGEDPCPVCARELLACQLARLPTSFDHAHVLANPEVHLKGSKSRERDEISSRFALGKFGRVSATCEIVRPSPRYPSTLPFKCGAFKRTPCPFAPVSPRPPPLPSPSPLPNVPSCLQTRDGLH